MAKIKKVQITLTEIYGGATDIITEGKPKLIAEVASIKMAKESIQAYLNVIHKADQVINKDETPGPGINRWIFCQMPEERYHGGYDICYCEDFWCKHREIPMSKIEWRAIVKD